MAPEINTTLLKNFFIQKIGDTMTRNEAQKLGLEDKFQEATDELDVNELDFEDVLDNNELYEQFAVMYTNEQEKKAQSKKGEDQEKEEQMQIKDKNKAGV
jgi:hypothetical protein